MNKEIELFLEILASKGNELEDFIDRNIEEMEVMRNSPGIYERA